MLKLSSLLSVGLCLSCSLSFGQDCDSLRFVRFEGHPLVLLPGQIAGTELRFKESTLTNPEILIHGFRLHEAMQPLYVVDGIRMVDLSLLSPNDIASVEVITNPSALLRYGNEAAYGVVKIETRRASQDGFHVDYRGRVGWWGKEEASLFRHTQDIAFQYKNRVVSLYSALSLLGNNRLFPDYSEGLSRYGLVVNAEANPLRWLHVGLSGNWGKSGLIDIFSCRIWQDVAVIDGLNLSPYLNYSNGNHKFATDYFSDSLVDVGLNTDYSCELSSGHKLSINSIIALKKRMSSFKYSSDSVTLFQYWMPFWVDASGILGYHWNGCVDVEGGVNYRFGNTDVGRFSSLSPAVSIRWSISDMPGLKTIMPKWFEHFSIKAGWGQTPVSPSDGTGTPFRSEASLPEKPVYPIMTGDLEPIYSFRGPAYKDLLILSSRRSVSADLRISALGQWSLAAEWYVSDDSMVLPEVENYAKLRNSGVDMTASWQFRTGEWRFDVGGVLSYYDNPASAASLMPKWSCNGKADVSWSKLGVMAYLGSLYGGQYGLYYGFPDRVLSKVKLSAVKLSFCYEDVAYSMIPRYGRFVVGVNIVL